MSIKWGFLRVSVKTALQSGNDPETGICRTGLDEYLKVIFPNTNDWIHDKQFGLAKDGSVCKRRPDYRSDSLMMIVEFDGLQHYTNPERIKSDIDSVNFYTKQGYKVIRIPYFIQLTNKTVKQMFGVDVEEQLFDETIASMSIENKNTPAYLCTAGVKRMANEFSLYKEQYEVNIKHLKSFDNQELSGASILENAMKQTDK